MALSLFLLFDATAFAAPARALPSFAQQTGQPCSACHVGAFGPQLKPYGRDFKLYGYQATDHKTKALPIAVTIQSSFTHTEAAQPPAAAPHFAANDNFALDQVSLYYGGRAPGGWGVFAQATYDGVPRGFNLDNVDLRRVKVFDLGDKDLVVGVDLNNNPGVQDSWNSTPAWRFPYNGSSLSPTPVAATLIDGGLQHTVAGAGAYLFWNYSLYAEATLYAPLDRVFAGRLGEGTNLASDRYAGPIPYWRFALNRDVGTKSSLEVGTYGLTARRYPGGFAEDGADRLTDVALDASYLNQALPKGQVVSAHATVIRETQDLDASRALFGTRGHDSLTTLRGDVSWSISDAWTPTVQLFHTGGTADPALYGAETARPDTTGYVVELVYTGWGRPRSPVAGVNWRAAVQYTGYSRFNGAGEGASANNTLFLSLWLAAAPFGVHVQH